MDLYEDRNSKDHSVTDSKRKIKVHYGEQYLKFRSRDWWPLYVFSLANKLHVSYVPVLKFVVVIRSFY